MRLRPLSALLAAALVATGCSGGGDDTEAFCTALRSEQALLRATPTEVAQIDAMVAAYRKIQPDVPTGVDDDWATIVSTFAAIRELDMSDADQRDKAFALALSDSLKQASSNVEAYAASTCSVDLRPATTAAATTVP